MTRFIRKPSVHSTTSGLASRHFALVEPLVTVAVVGHHRIRMRQLKRQAEGYLELGMPQQALETLARLGPVSRPSSHLLHLRGEALRALERYEEALLPLG